MAPGSLGGLNIALSADTVKFISDMGRAAHVVETSVGKMQRAFGTLQKAAGVLGGTIGVGAFVASIKNVINQADELGKLSQKVGVTVENLSSLKYAAELSDVSMEGLTTGLKKLATNMLEASSGSKEALALFKGLNVEFESAPGKLLPTDEVLLKIADRFSKMEDGAAKAALAVKIFGREGLALVPFLNLGAAGIERLKEELQKLGRVMSAEMAKKAEQFNDNLKSVGVAANALKIEIANTILPALADIAEDMKKAAIEAGVLEAALVGLRGAATRLFETSNQNKLRSIQSEIARLQAQVKEAGPVGPAKVNTQNKLNEKLREERELTTMMEFLGELPSPEMTPANWKKRSPKAQFDASMFGVDGKKSKEKLDVGKQLAEDQEEWNKIMAEAAAAADKYNGVIREREALEYKWGSTFENMTIEQIREWEKQQYAAIDGMREIEERNARLNAGFDENGQAIKKMADESKEWGFVFNSALEDAIINGKKLSDVMKSLAQDIARMIIRKSITEPIAGAIGKAIGGIFGGGKAEGGPVMGGSAYLVGESGPELFVPGMSGAIVPNHALAAGGGQAVTINLNVQSLDPRTATSAILANMPAIAATLRQAAARRGNSTPF